MILFDIEVLAGVFVFLGHMQAPSAVSKLQIAECRILAAVNGELYMGMGSTVNTRHPRRLGTDEKQPKMGKETDTGPLRVPALRGDSVADTVCVSKPVTRAMGPLFHGDAKIDHK